MSLYDVILTLYDDWLWQKNNNVFFVFVVVLSPRGSLRRVLRMRSLSNETQGSQLSDT